MTCGKKKGLRLTRMRCRIRRMEPIIDFLRRRLKESGPRSWDAIAAEAGVAQSLPRKVAYGDRDNPGVRTVQPLVDFFQRQDSVKRKRPALQKEAALPNESPCRLMPGLPPRVS